MVKENQYVSSKGGETMKKDVSPKKYTKPELTVYGDVSVITAQNGSSFVDVPLGSNCCNVAGS